MYEVCIDWWFPGLHLERRDFHVAPISIFEFAPTFKHINLTSVWPTRAYRPPGWPHTAPMWHRSEIYNEETTYVPDEVRNLISLYDDCVTIVALVRANSDPVTHEIMIAEKDTKWKTHESRFVPGARE